MRAMTGGSRTTARRVRIEWILAACCAWAPLVAQAVAPRISVIMVDDFDGQPNSMNSMFGGRDRINGGTLIIESQTLAGKAIRYIYDVTTTDAGWFTRLDGRSAYRGRDLGDAIALRFHVRGVASTTRIRVELRDFSGASATAEVTGITPFTYPLWEAVFASGGSRRSVFLDAVTGEMVKGFSVAGEREE